MTITSISQLAATTSNMEHMSDGSSDIWNNLLNSVTSTQVLPTKNIIVLGGGSEGSEQFVKSLRKASRSQVASQIQNSTHKKQQEAPIAAKFGLGYTYFDIEDTENDELFARLCFHLLPNLEQIDTSILTETLVSLTLENTLVCLLLDWKDPRCWLRELKLWVTILRSSVSNLSETSTLSRNTIKEITNSWAMRLRNYSVNSSVTYPSLEGDQSVILELEPGQYDEPIGLPLMCVAQNADYTNNLEREKGLKEPQFDYIQQMIRTILLKRVLLSKSVALISVDDNLERMLSLPARHIGKSASSKALVVERDQVFIPPGWDSWGKIRVLREGFDAEGVSLGWSAELSSATDTSVLEGYETTVSEMNRDSIASLHAQSEKQVIALSHQEYLAQLRLLQLASVDTTAPHSRQEATEGDTTTQTLESSIVGPMQITGGTREIELSAKEVSERQEKLKESNSLGRQSGTEVRELANTSSNISETTGKLADGSRDEVVKNFFQSLLVKRAKDTAK